jgi:hypothetical protein
MSFRLLGGWDEEAIFFEANNDSDRFFLRALT